MTTIAILLPGTSGSTLVDSSSNVIWPTAVLNAVDQGDVQAALQLLEQSELVAQQPIGWGDPTTAYGSLQAFFEKQQFSSAVVTSVGNLPSTLSDRQLLGFAYDWRDDNTTTAILLGEIVSTLAAGGAEIWLIGHSMGGIVARALLEPAAAASSPPSWLGNVAGLITLGTPHLGAPMALQAILGQLPLALGIDVAALITAFVDKNGNPEWDSTYELLPPPTRNFIFIGTTPVSVFDPRVQASLLRHGASQQFLSEAQTFFGTLAYKGEAKLPPYYCAYGVTLALTTITYAYVPLLDSWTPFALPSAGDEIVPSESAMFVGFPTTTTYQANGVTHLELPKDAGVQDYIAKTMKLASS